jgi:hypothetical protein
MNKQVHEAEIIQEPKGFSYKESYATYTTQAKGTSVFVWSLTIVSLFLSFIPVIGFILAWVALIANIIKKIPPIIPIIALIISSFITTIFLFIAWLIGLIF